MNGASVSGVENDGISGLVSAIAGVLLEAILVGELLAEVVNEDAALGLSTATDAAAGEALSLGQGELQMAGENLIHRFTSMLPG
jgi:hypothetical protein